jgi:hypothetical protein
MLPADGTTLAGLIRSVRATYDPLRAELGEPVAIITVKVVQASPLPVVRAPFLYFSGSVDNSYTPCCSATSGRLDGSVRRQSRA